MADQDTTGTVKQADGDAAVQSLSVGDALPFSGDEVGSSSSASVKVPSDIVDPRVSKNDTAVDEKVAFSSVGEPEEAPLVVIMHASVGSGHKSAAVAIAQAFEGLKGTADVPAHLRVEVLDVLEFARIPIDGNKTASLFTGATRPFYDITWRYTLTGRLLWGGGTAWSRIMFPSFTAYVREKRPAVVIATHITAANVAVGARMLSGVEYPVVCVPTDYEVEGFWPHKECDLFCVATEAMAETLRPRRVEDERITITGIPVRPGFGKAVQRDEVLDRFGLPHDKTIVLVMAGASLPQPYVRFRQAMELTVPFLRSFDQMHFVFLPGRDERYEGNLRRLFEAMKLDNASVLGFVDDMAGLMQAADLAILKSGGLTVTECLCARLPMILLGKSYGQEKSNTVMLTALGAALHVTTARELIGTLRHVHDLPAVRRALLVGGEALRRPQAAQDVAKAALGCIGTVRPRKKHFVEFYWGGKPAHTR